ncbi:hypothetical protein [Sulfitobacter sp. 1A15106]|uniref:hypothetical protein n=1 Tax=Sulfitobacter sp. 1A15106 TaxID=3368590 RepID=UPI003745C4F4
MGDKPVTLERLNDAIDTIEELEDPQLEPVLDRLYEELETMEKRAQRRERRTRRKSGAA